jgi:hypothetical protein
MATAQEDLVITMKPLKPYVRPKIKSINGFCDRCGKWARCKPVQVGEDIHGLCTKCNKE